MVLLEPRRGARWLVLLGLTLGLVVFLLSRATYQRNLRTLQDRQDRLHALLDLLQPPSCGDAILLPEMTAFLSAQPPGPDTIFFTETSGSGIVRPRFACALEAAARLHPGSQVLLLMAYSPPTLEPRLSPALAAVLRQHENVRALRVDLQLLAAGSPLEQLQLPDWLLRHSSFLEAHTSDVLRLLTLWRYGGKYFDLDVILARNLTGVHRFVTPMSEEHTVLANGMLGLERGSPVALRALKRLSRKFDGQDWSSNGPTALTEAMEQRCGVPVANMTKQLCRGFHVLPYTSFFPVQWFELELYFDEVRSAQTMQRLERLRDQLTGFHIGNNLSREWQVRVGSRQPYSLIAQERCPRAYWSCHTSFD